MAKIKYVNNSTPPLSADNVNLFMQGSEFKRVPVYAVVETNHDSSNVYTAVADTADGNSFYHAQLGALTAEDGDEIIVKFSSQELVKNASLIVVDAAGRRFNASAKPIKDYNGRGNRAFPLGTILHLVYNGSVGGGSFVIASGSGSGDAGAYTGGINGLKNGYTKTVKNQTSTSHSAIITSSETMSNAFVLVNTIFIANTTAASCAVGKRTPSGTENSINIAQGLVVPNGGIDILNNPIILTPGDQLYCWGADNTSPLITVCYSCFADDGSTLNTYNSVGKNIANTYSDSGVTISSNSNGGIIISNILCNKGTADAVITCGLGTHNAPNGYFIYNFNLPQKSSIDLCKACGTTLWKNDNVFYNISGATVSTLISYITFN